jgi:hypothetical protein
MRNEVTRSPKSNEKLVLVVSAICLTLVDTSRDAVDGPPCSASTDAQSLHNLCIALESAE